MMMMMMMMSEPLFKKNRLKGIDQEAQGFCQNPYMYMCCRLSPEYLNGCRLSIAAFDFAIVLNI